MAHAHQAPLAYRLDHLRIEQPGQRHPAWLGRRPLVLAAWWLHPLTEMGEERRGVLLEAVRQEEWHTAGCQHLHDLVDYALRHGQRPVPDVDGQQQFTLGVHRGPDPLRRTLQTLDGLHLTNRTLLDGAEQGK